VFILNFSWSTKCHMIKKRPKPLKNLFYVFPMFFNVVLYLFPLSFYFIFLNLSFVISLFMFFIQFCIFSLALSIFLLLIPTCLFIISIFLCLSKCFSMYLFTCSFYFYFAHSCLHFHHFNVFTLCSFFFVLIIFFLFN